MGSDLPGLPEDLSLGDAIVFLRRRTGMPQRELTRKLGLSARSNLSDYERGRRVPPSDIVLACEEIFELRDAELQRLRQRTLGERARESILGTSPVNGGAVAKDSAGHVPGLEAADGASPAPREADAMAGAPGPGARRRARARFQRVVIATVATGVVAVLVVVVSLWTGSGDHPAALVKRAPPTPQAVRATGHDLTHHDGDDPMVTGCGQDVVTLADTPVLFPDGAVFGRLLLRHSSVCEMSWGAVRGPNPKLYRVYIIASRPSDHLTAPSSWAGNTPPGSYGNMLSTASGCVQVSAYVQTPTAAGPRATTICVK